MKPKATIYRLNMPDHICPYGLKAKDLLLRKGYDVDDQRLESPEQADAIKKQYKVKTTPQIIIDNKRIGRYEDLVEYLGVFTFKQQGTSYQPIIAIFATCLLMAFAICYSTTGSLSFIKTAELFIATSMCVLGIMKLRDIYSFSNQFLNYDLLAQRYVPYATAYPFLETGAGVLMVAGWQIIPAAITALFIGSIGAVSVFKAVFIDKRELKCACVGGESNVPLGFISLTENIMMILMATWMLVKALLM